ncbi:unnamed protein product [Paramecium primaurelia]|uniref:Transmembrane protein n=1 Tax=Paramecium primaurelia TaxID=5886 RepID=A0A8S1QCF3_PARPR|nr:unnamed protein product [Paramecium primaurelia]
MMSQENSYQNQSNQMKPNSSQSKQHKRKLDQTMFLILLLMMLELLDIQILKFMLMTHQKLIWKLEKLLISQKKNQEIYVILLEVITLEELVSFNIEKDILDHLILSMLKIQMVNTSLQELIISLQLEKERNPQFHFQMIMVYI